MLPINLICLLQDLFFVGLVVVHTREQSINLFQVLDQIWDGDIIVEPIMQLCEYFGTAGLFATINYLEKGTTPGRVPQMITVLEPDSFVGALMPKHIVIQANVVFLTVDEKELVDQGTPEKYYTILISAKGGNFKDKN